MTRERVRQLLQEGHSISEIAEIFALAKSTVCYHARRLGWPADERFAARYDWMAVRRHYEQGFSARECMERFGFNPSAWYDAVARGDIVPRSRQSELALRLNGDRSASRAYVKRNLLAEGLKADACERCGIRDWRGRPLSLHLHHINGDGSDNRLANLQVLCPNCHSQTDTYGGRNRRSTGPTMQAAW